MARKKIERNISYDEERKRYYVNLDYGKDPETGKQVKKTRTFNKLTEARTALRKHEADRDRGLVVIPKELTLGQWLKRWMADVIELNRAETTVYAYKKIIDNHIQPALGEVELQALKPQQLQKYYAMLIREKGLSSNTARKHHDLLNAALKVAVKQGLILKNPAEAVEPPKVVRPEIRYYSMEELQRLFQLAKGTRMELLIKLAGYLGLRREEILGLTWSAVDLEHQRLRVISVRTAAGKEIVEKEPKTETSQRVLYLPDDLVETLRQTREQQLCYKKELGPTYQDLGYVVTHEDGRPVRPNYASDLFVKFIRDHDLPPITLHGLRHSFASIANAKGIPMYDIGKALGHSSPATTSKIYTHLLDQDHQNMMEALWGSDEEHCPDQ